MLGDNLSQMENGQPKVQPSSGPPRKTRKTDGVETARILVEENSDIPPTGLFLGHNGRGYMLKPGVPVVVPLPLLEILDNAITTIPVFDNTTRQIVGYRDRLRFPYRRLADKAA